MNKKLSLAISLHQDRNLQEAKALYKKLLSENLTLNESEILYTNYANILFLQNSYDLAITFYTKAIEINPQAFKTFFNLGVLYLNISEYLKAKENFLEAIKIKEDYLNAYINLGVCYKKLKKYNLSLKCYEKAIFYKTDDIDARYNKANLLHTLEKYKDAIRQFDIVLSLDKSNYKAYYSKGLSLLALGKYSQALFHYEKAIELKEDYADAHFAKSNILLLYGDYKEGFKEYDYRWEAKNELKKASYNLPFYNNEDLNNKTILIAQEQGFGDNIQFIRFINYLKVKKNPKKIYFAVNNELRTLFEDSFYDIEFVSNNQTLYNVDYYTSLMCLPNILNLDLEDVKIKTPYLTFKANKKKIKKQNFKLHIGFFYQGNKKHKNDKNRSIDAVYFHQLFSLKEVAFYSLQIENVENFKTSNVYDCSKSIKDFKDTANIISQLDLVITIDSSIAHLCGALGKNCWVLLPFIPDWRWMIERSDTVWYDSLKLYRQKKDKNWQIVFDKIFKDLNFILEKKDKKFLLNKKNTI
ncbi:tetratricopeptide repeat protein [Malaciobacter mytili]|uniref:tetratricopeptide repeat protein n=1 Tax=Malaciobacter mytili TaxID=603050 RepID=UPI003A8BFF89